MLDTHLKRSANEAWYVSGRASQADRFERSLQMIGDYNCRPGLVYDLGSATGHFARLLAGIADQVVGVERMADRVHISRQANSDVANLSFIEGDFLDLDIAVGSADVITMLEMLYYVEPSLRPDFLDKVWRTLKPGGLLLISLNVFAEDGAARERDLMELIGARHRLLARQTMHRMYYYRLELPLVRLLDELTYLEHVKVFYPHNLSIGHTIYSPWLDRALLRPSWLLDRLLIPVARRAALALLGSRSLYRFVTGASRALCPDAARSQLIVLAERPVEAAADASKEA